MGFELLLIGVALLFAVPVVLRRLHEGGDPEWEQRWQELPQLERDRIAAAVRRREPLGPQDASLAVGLARDQRRIVAVLTQPSIAHLALATVLLVGALFFNPWPVFVLTFAVLAFLIWVAYRDRVTRRNLTFAEALPRRE